MICLDSNIFLIDRFFKRDVHYAANRRLVERLPALEAGLSIYSLLEICGLASFNLSSDELARWFYNFDRYYPLKVLLPIGLERTAEQYFANWLASLYQMFTRRMTFADAAILSIAEQYAATHFLTWNKRHFEGRTAVQVMTPEEFMATMPPP
jgi:predicted nucleic acid-binding protein